MLRFLTAGESHGKAILVILDGYPANVKISIENINYELKRRQAGFGRSERMQIEKDEVEVISGLKHNTTFGAPISLVIKNKDYTIDKLPILSSPRPGHADLPGGLKYGFKDLRLALERASARETVARVAIGSLSKQFLEKFNISIFSHVVQIGTVRVKKSIVLKKIPRIAESSCLRCIDKFSEKQMLKLIAEAQKKGDTLGGIFEVLALNLPPGLGSYAQWDKRLDALIAMAIFSIPGIKAVEIGDGIENSVHFGSEVQDEIYYKKEKGFYRKTNRAGGIEAGVSNGMPIIVRGYMKPIATLGKPLKSVDIITKKPTQASKERADVCAVPSAGVIAESMLAYIIMDSFLEKFGCDNFEDIKANYKNYLKRIRNY